MRSSCAGHSSCNVIHLTSGTDPESSKFCQTSSSGHPVPTPVSHLRRRRTYTLRLTSAGRRTSASHKGQNPSLRNSPVGRLSTVPLHRRVPPGGGPLPSGGKVCYVYSLPLCYFTQSALPNYQTGCCSVLHVLLCPAKRIRRAAYLFAHL